MSDLEDIGDHAPIDGGHSIEDLVEDSWEQHTLDVVKQRDTQLKEDIASIQNEVTGKHECPLCQMEDDQIPGVTSEVAKIFSTERRNLRTMEERDRFKIVKKQANQVIDRNRQLPAYVNGVRTPRFKRVTQKAVRAHFLGGHDRDKVRQIYDEIDYLHATLQALRHGPLWRKNTTPGRSGEKQPDINTHNLMIRLQKQVADLYTLVDKLERARAASNSLGGGLNRGARNQNRPFGSGRA